MIYDFWYYVLVFVCKFGVLCNGVFFKDWVLLVVIEWICCRFVSIDDGNWQMVDIFNVVLIDGLLVVEVVCVEVFGYGVYFVDVVFNILVR